MVVLKRGDRGDHVKVLQQALRAYGRKVDVDGDFGPGTERTVEAVQAGAGLEADGVVDDEVWFKLLAQPAEIVVPGMDEVLEALADAVNPLVLSPAGRALAWLEAVAPHLVEDEGSNEGKILSPLLIDRYRACWGVPEGIDLPWCSIVAFAAQAVAMGILPADLDGAESRATWKKHPLKAWHGATWRAEQAAKEAGLWTQTPESAALGLMLRAGSGSDAARGGVAEDGSYKGHTDVIIQVDGDEVEVWAGNVSDKLTRRRRKISVYRGFVPLRK